MTSEVDDRRGGAALFVVLIFTIIIANLALLALRSSSSEIRATSLFVDRARADELGRSIIPLTKYFISGDVGLRTRGGSFTTQFTDGSVTIDYLSESARVDINHSPVDLLKAILLTAGLSQSRVDVILNTVKQRRSVQPKDQYESSFEIVDDWTLSDTEAERIIPLLTTANDRGAVDPLLADPAILSVLFGGSEARLTQFREKRMIGFPDEETALSYFSDPARKWVQFGAVRAVRAVARVTTLRGLRRSYEAVFDAPGDGKDEKIYYWRPLA